MSSLLARARASEAGERPLAVWLLTAALAAPALVLVVLSVRHLGAPASPSHLPWWALAVLFFLVERFAVHVRLGENAYSFTLSELPLVLGLFFAAPGELVVARLAGAFAVLALTPGSRQRPTKLVFNLTLFTLETALAATIFATLASADDPFTSRGVAAALLATVGATLLAGLAVFLVIVLAGRGTDRRRPAAALALAAAVTLANSVLALAGAALFWFDPQLGWLLFAPAVLLVLAQRRWVRLDSLSFR